MSIAAEITVATQEQRKNIEHLVRYTSANGQITISDGQRLCLTTRDGQLQLEGLNTICRFIAGLGEKKDYLIGSDTELQTQISEWLSYRSAGLSPITEEKLHAMNDHLLTRTFLAGNQPSVADICMFAALHRPLANLPVSQIARFSSLFRWYDCLQYTTGALEIYSPVLFTKSGLPASLKPSQPALPDIETSGLQEYLIIGTPQKLGSSKAKEGGLAQSKGTAEGVSKAVLKDSPGSGKEGAVGPEKKLPEISPAAAPATPPLIPPAPKPETQAGDDAAVAKKAKKEARKEALKQAELAKKQEEEVRIDMLDIRVGQILEVTDHPKADSLYVEQIDFGDGHPKQVVSGLRNFLPKDQMLGRRVAVCTNLKPAKMREVMSYGMVLCASTKSHEKVDPLAPPVNALLGERISVPGYTNDALQEINPKKKILEKLKEDLVTDSIGVATYKNNPFMCASGPVTSSFPNALIG